MGGIISIASGERREEKNRGLSKKNTKSRVTGSSGTNLGCAGLKKAVEGERNERETGVSITLLQETEESGGRMEGSLTLGEKRIDLMCAREKEGSKEALGSCDDTERGRRKRNGGTRSRSEVAFKSLFEHERDGEEDGASELSKKGTRI